ncbi:natural cytotoxicity triggering receptor 3-like isoform X2 [Scyliorhinus canicula]|uniref:natural cytotoxicity triggering receptor 3-like isoform X2 n=1 Tax=Scyliorhinus canicula TaxID=7830 RepID=UPI0018F68ECD|nr:natural cytotoxicity triggering receptor 3-like isoform X2 [Scyliorhinus canicula]
MVFSLVLCLLTLGLAAVAENVTVVQSPASINVTEGEIAVLHCTQEGLSGVVVYMWYRDSKDGTEVSNSTPEYKGRVNGSSKDQKDRNTGVSIQVTNVTLSDAATYYCKVESITGTKYYGQGTTLIVTAKTWNQTQLLANSGLLHTALYCLLALFLVIPTVVYCRKRSKEKHDERPPSRNDNQANEADNVQYCTLIFREGKRTLRTSIDKDKTACG